MSISGIPDEDINPFSVKELKKIRGRVIVYVRKPEEMTGRVVTAVLKSKRRLYVLSDPHGLSKWASAQLQHITDKNIPPLKSAIVLDYDHQIAISSLLKLCDDMNDVYVNCVDCSNTQLMNIASEIIKNDE